MSGYRLSTATEPQSRSSVSLVFMRSTHTSATKRLWRASNSQPALPIQLRGGWQDCGMSVTPFR